MKIVKYIFLTLTLSLGVIGCTDLDIPPKNIIQDKEIYASENGIRAELARQYSQLPIEDFRYTPRRGFNHFWIIDPFPTITGEALGGQTSAQTEHDDARKFFADAYKLLRDVNYFLETLPTYVVSSGFSQDQVNLWTGEAYFIRAATYMALVKRYGGVPLVLRVLDYPKESIEAVQFPRESEEAVYDQIAKDLDEAYKLLPEINQTGRVNKYAAAGFKSRAMLFAGSIAKYNTITLTDKDGKRLCGIPAAKASDYFKASYDAAKLLEGKYSLYKKGWVAGDKNAQYLNYTSLFFDAASEENIFIRKYGYPESVHGYDCYNIPFQFQVAGYSSAVNPTLDFVEMFDGLPMKDGKVNVLDDAGKYNLYDKQMDFFANAEPRLRANVIFPGDEFKSQVVEIWRGIYTGPTAGGISPLLTPAEEKVKYESSSAKGYLVTSSSPEKQTVYTLPDGTKMNGAGRSGRFYDNAGPALTGFSVRKYLNPTMPAADVKENRSDQSWIELRYAEILLNRAEAAYELLLAGKNDADYQNDAYICINQIRERAGAELLNSSSDLNLDVVRTERRKELAFENKIWWDLKRWRVMEQEQTSRTYRVLMPFYAAESGKWFFDSRYEERNAAFTFDTRWYYEEIRGEEINKNPKLIQNPGY